MLADGEQISLDMREPDAAVFTVMRKVEGRGADAGVGYGSFDARYFSEDGNWMWNASEWVAAS